MLFRSVIQVDVFQSITQAIMSRNTYLFFLFGFFSLTIAACSPRAHQHDDLAAPAEVPSRALTKWSVHEFFVEHDLAVVGIPARSEEHTSELQSRRNLVCRLLLEKKKNTTTRC